MVKVIRNIAILAGIAAVGTVCGVAFAEHNQRKELNSQEQPKLEVKNA